MEGESPGESRCTLCQRARSSAAEHWNTPQTKTFATCSFLSFTFEITAALFGFEATKLHTNGSWK